MFGFDLPVVSLQTESLVASASECTPRVDAPVMTFALSSVRFALVDVGAYLMRIWRLCETFFAIAFERADRVDAIRVMGACLKGQVCNFLMQLNIRCLVQKSSQNTNHRMVCQLFL